MSVQIIDHDVDTLSLLFSNYSLHILNALRRVMIAEIPIVAIELVEIKQNGTPLPDEMFAHRLGLVPIPENPVNMSFPHECQCQQHCSLCAKVYNVQRDPVPDPSFLTSNQIFGLQTQDDPVVVMKIPANALLHFSCVARKGVGKQHAKWIPAVVGFIPLKKNFFWANESKGEKIDPYKPRFPITEEKILSKLDEKEFADGIHTLIHVETISTLSPAQITITAIEVLRLKLSQVAAALEQLNQQQTLAQ